MDPADLDVNAEVKEDEWPQGYGELPDQIGQVDEVQPQDRWMFEPMETYLQLAGYDQPSGQWFMRNGGGKLGYGLSGGTMKPQEEASASLIAASGEVVVDRNVRIRLSQWESRNAEPMIMDETVVSVASVQGQKTLYATELPNDENRAYLLTMEILNEQNEVEDILGNAIYVPAPEVNVSWKADQESYSSEFQADFVLYNAGPTVLTLGTYYSIEKKVGEEWRTVPLDMAFQDIGIVLTPGQQYDQPVKIEGLDEGFYRVVKTVNAEGVDSAIDLAAEFRIENP